jgi:hypothetical protein
MPKLRPTREQLEIRNFNGFVLSRMKILKLKQSDIAECLELPRPSVTMRLAGQSRWTLPEMIKVCELLGETYTIGTVR